MKRILFAILLVVLLLSACAPAPTAAPQVLGTSTVLPTEVPSPTAPVTVTPVPTRTPTITPTRTPTPTPMPTIPLDGISGVPYPKNDDLKPAVQEYAQAMGLEAATVQSSMTYKTFRDYRGTLFVAALVKDGTPLLVSFRDPASGTYTWQQASLKDLARTLRPDLEISQVFTEEKDLWSDARYLDVLNKDFGTIELTSGIAWKWFEPEPGKFNQFMLADVKRQLEVFKGFTKTTIFKRVHPLVWAEHEPTWLLPGTYTRDQAIKALQDHIKTVMALFNETAAHEWIVVNEPYFKATKSEYGFDYTRTDPLHNIIGPDYIEIAFQTAREIDPSGILIYNDTSNNSLNKRDTKNSLYTGVTQANVNSLKAKGLIDGVGMEMHLDAATPPSEDDLIKTMQSYGVPVYVTEMDVDLSKIGGTEQERLAKQAEIYATVLRAALKSGVCKSFGFYDMGDKYSWLIKYQNEPQSAEPTLFDDNFNPKPAYYALLRVLLNQPR